MGRNAVRPEAQTVAAIIQASYGRGRICFNRPMLKPLRTLCEKNAGMKTRVSASTANMTDTRLAAVSSAPRLQAARGSRRRAHGFTLIELMVVVMILGVLAALVVPRFMSRPDEARAVAAKADIAAIMQQLKLYRLDNGRYPTTEQGLDALVNRPTSGPSAKNWKSYLDKAPVDPWGKPYQYLNPGVHSEIDVFSYGADGVAGGEAGDADIGSWDL